MQPFFFYAAYLLAACALLVVFLFVYTRVTPYREVELIRAGKLAPAISLGGALIGFSLTLASSVQHNDNLVMFIVWALAAMVVQVLAYALLSRAISGMAEALEADNVAMGTLMGSVALAVGLVNAACLA
jgi:putative membrane protein